MSREFAIFLTHYGIRHTGTSPHYPQANGHGEALVKAIKHLIMKVMPSGNINCEAFDRELLKMRNTPNYTGRSPAQVLCGCPLRSCVPAHPVAYETEWQPAEEECALRAAQRDQEVISCYDTCARMLPALNIYQRVRIQDLRTHRCDQTGTVLAYHAPHQYDVRLPCDRVLRRNRRFLRPDTASTDPSSDAPAPQDSPSLQRSERLHQQEAMAVISSYVHDFAMNSIGEGGVGISFS